MVRIAVTLLVLLLAAASARAQSAYVAGTISADVSRVNHTDSNFSSSGVSGGDETLSGSLRVGTAVGQSWGVELEFVHSGRSHDQLPSTIFPLASTTVYTTPPTIASAISAAVGVNAIPAILPFQSDIRRSHSDLDALLWGRQSVSGSVDLVYLGGVAFSRERIEITQNFPTAIRLLAPVANGGFRTTATNYGTRPIAGIEARIRLTSHVRLIPGMRLQGIQDGWLIRPYAGLGWFF